MTIFRPFCITLITIVAWYYRFTGKLFLFSGVHSIAYAFPKVKLVTTAVDPEVSDDFHINPGIGKYIYLQWSETIFKPLCITSIT